MINPEKTERLAKANQAIEIIARFGRKFFSHHLFITRLELDQRGLVWLIDGYSHKRIYPYGNHRWKGFSEGGTLRALIIALRNYISKGDLVPPQHFGPWPKWYSEGEPWGYGEDMVKVREEVGKLGILEVVGEREE